MKEALLSLMLADARLAALVGARINWDVFPQGIASPAIRLARLGGAVGMHMRGVDGLDGALVQVDVRARAPEGNDAGGAAEAEAVARAVTALLAGYRGTHAGTHFAGVFPIADRSGAEKIESEVFHLVSLDFDIWSRVAA